MLPSDSLVIKILKYPVIEEVQDLVLGEVSVLTYPSVLVLWRICYYLMDRDIFAVEDF